VPAKSQNHSANAVEQGADMLWFWIGRHSHPGPDRWRRPLTVDSEHAVPDVRLRSVFVQQG
jgi:hypothetical protein